jgi:hypothetical protein
MRTSWHEATGQTWDLPVPAQGASTHARFFDPAGPPSLAISCLAVLPSAFETASAPGNSDFVAQWLAYALPYRRFVDVLANGNARLGADVVRYAFIVSDFHRLLLAGLPAHFESDMPSHGVGLCGGISEVEHWSGFRTPADRRHTSLKRLLGVVLGEKDRDRRMTGRLVARRADAVPVIGDVRMGVDEARNASVAGKIDHLGAGRYRRIENASTRASKTASTSPIAALQVTGPAPRYNGRASPRPCTSESCPEA